MSRFRGGCPQIHPEFDGRTFRPGTGQGPVCDRASHRRQRGAAAGPVHSLEPHLNASDISTQPLVDGAPRLLVIEDFNTLGLTGTTDQLDEGNFRNFWRRHGRSGKTGKAGGRWGLGKLVYSSASCLSCFFGLTVRDGDPTPLLIGQAVLRTHEFQGVRRPPHGFWFSQATERGLQLPVRHSATIAALLGNRWN